MRQLQAGYFINAIIDKFVKEEKNDKIRKLLHYLSHFSLETNSDLDVKINDSVVAVINNMISRGLPTYPSTFIEDRIATTFIKTKKFTTGSSFSYKFINDELDEEILRSLHIVDPRFTSNDITSDYFGNDKQTESLLKDFMPVNIGEYFIQFFSRNRNISHIVENSPANEGIVDVSKESYASKDFNLSVELPYSINDKLGLTIELTTPKDKLNIDFLEQEKIHETLSKLKWKDNAIITDQYIDDAQEYQKIIDFTFDEYFDTIRKNYSSPLYNTDYGLDAMQIALTPLAAARIQKTILSYILSGELSLSADKWKIGIVERDIPAAFLAIEDLNHHFENLFKLEGLNRKLPEIDFSIFYTPEFENAQLNILFQGKINPIEDFDSNEEFDLLIDTSILRRSNFDFVPLTNSAKHVAKVRSSEYIEKGRDFVFASKILYQTYFYENINKTFKQKEQETVTRDGLNFFFKNIFRKEKLSYLQFKFLNALLSNQNALAVVPANEQKEILYKFVTLLQPGISIIVTPLMSALKYQFDDLADNMIDATSYFSASTQKIHDKYLSLYKIKNGKSLFNYITPDRLHLPEFRQVLRETFENKVTFSFVVVDQAHCVSEWSHDFRPLYATILNNFRIVSDKYDVPQFACFSETSSYDVINDIKYYFAVKDENYVNVELTVKNVSLKLVPVKSEDLSGLEAAELSLYNAKRNYIKENIENRNIVFTGRPSKLAEELSNDKLSAAAFEGTIGDKLHTISTLKSRQSYKNFERYIDSEIDVLSTTYSLSIGCEIPANKIFMDVPTSLELFVQTLGKTHVSDDVDVEILYSDDNIAYTEKEYDFDDEGNLIEKQFSSETNVEEIGRSRVFKRVNTNLKKELQIINEIMTSVTYPKESIADILMRRIHYSFDIWIRMESQPEAEPTKLYIYDENDYVLGNIDFEKNQINNMAPASRAETADQILAFIKYDIEKIVSDGSEIFNILYDKIGLDTSDGINSLWTNLKKGENATLTVEFYNNAVSKFITKFFKEQQIGLNQNHIIDIYENSTDGEEFLSKFVKFFNLDKIQYKAYNLEIQNLFWNFRNFFDTVPAIYRLFSVGIINDFVIDFQNQQFTLVLTKKSDTDIINKIYDKISPFVTKNKAFEVFEKIPKTKGISILAKAVNYYQQFVFYHILGKRRQSFDTIFSYIKKFKDQADMLMPFLNNYFTAKYILELKENTDDTNLKIVERYFNKESLMKDELLHLRRSSELILNLYEDNCNMLIINGLSGVLIYSDSDSKLFEESIEKLAKGVSVYREKYEKSDFNKKIIWILDIIGKFDLDAKSKVENLFLLKVHTNWLSSFNKKLKGLYK